MSWAVGWDDKHQRHVGYGVPAHCDHPGCLVKIDRGLAYVCSDGAPFGGTGCGLYFCPIHSDMHGRCEACRHGRTPFAPAPEHQDWISHVLTDDGWQKWCEKYPDLAQKLREQLRFAAIAN